MSNLRKVRCKNCDKVIYRPVGRINENFKLGYKSYCSRRCEYRYKTKREKLTCENCNKVFERTPSSISLHNYCSLSCAAVVNNKKSLKGRAKIKPKLKICIQCGKSFKKNTGNKKYCSLACRRMAERKTSGELIKIIRQSAKKLKRTPTRREIKEDKTCQKTFGSWNNAILAAGFIPNRSHDNRMYKRSYAKAIDGHLCDSISELLIDNWLYRNDIPHERNTRYPNTHHKADWEILFKKQKIFVEYFGLANDSLRYDQTIKEKKNLCRKNNIPLIEIYPKDIFPQKFLGNSLKNKFKKFLQG